MLDIAAAIPPYVQTALTALSRAGKRGYLVGGSLRDLLRGKVPHDFDLTTSATPDEMLEIFRNFRVIPTGLAHGTVTVLIEGQPVEITTHRTDGTYTDSRHPDSVCFTTDLREDLARRDFTVNAMAFSADRGLVDPFGGQKDLANGVLRAVGDPVVRFTEDALRILRCFRFAAQLDFKIEEKTAAGAAACAAQLGDIAVERIFSELVRTVVCPAAEKGLLGLHAAGCAPYVFFDTVPDLSRLFALKELPPEAALRIAALLHEKTDEEVRLLSRRWHTPNAFLEGVLAYLAILKDSLPKSAYEARRFVCTHYPYFDNGLLLRAALQGEDVAEARALTKGVLRDGTAVEIRRLAVNGKELQERVGVRPEKTAVLLRLLQDAVWQAPEKNRREALLLEARRICEKESLT